jgi:polysaccharide biosynthesis protein PslH
VRAYYVLRHLVRRHAVTVVSFTRPNDPPEAVEHLRTFCAAVHTCPMRRSLWQEITAAGRSFLKEEPFLISRDQVQGMADLLGEVVRGGQFDAIHADQLWMAPYALYASSLCQKMGRRPTPLVLDQHNAVFKVAQRMALNTSNFFVRLVLERETGLMTVYEAKTCGQFDQVVWVTEEDRQSVVGARRGFNPQTRHKVIPICIDPGDTQPLGPDIEKSEILFLGGMHWPPNADGVRWFSTEILPRVKATVPGVIFNAVGKVPPPELERLAGVNAPGFVIDPEVYWRTCRVFIVPLRAAGGMRVKILDAWAHGVPVVSTTIGAEGIGYQDGEDILIADTPEDFASAIERILTDRTLAEAIGRAGRRTVEGHYDWRRSYSAWDDIYAG